MNGTWTTLEIAGKTAEVYDLPGGKRPRFGVLHLHGVGLETLRDNPSVTRLFDEELERILRDLPSEASEAERETFPKARRIAEDMIRAGEFDPV